MQEENLKNHLKCTKNSLGDPEVIEQVRSDNDASEVDILGHLCTFWDIMGQFGRFNDEFGAFRVFS